MEGKKNYFILGLGLGIIIVNIIYYFNPKLETRDLTDEEIILRAEELGMVNIKDRIEIEKDEIDQIEDNKQDLTSEEEEEVKEAKKVKDEEKKIETIEIKKGASLTDTAEELFEKGLIEDKKEFKKIINEKNLSKNIRYGTYEIEKGSSYEDIIDKIVK